MNFKIALLSLLLSLFLTLSSFLVSNELNSYFPPRGADYLVSYGLPLPFYQSGGFAGISNFLPVTFILDLVFWFIISFIPIKLLTAFVKLDSKKTVTIIAIILILLNLLLIKMLYGWFHGNIRKRFTPPGCNK